MNCCFSTSSINRDQQQSCGRISFTADAWSSLNISSYLALTAHWISLDQSTKRLRLRAALIGFHRLKTKHTGINVAKTILYLLDRANITHKVRASFVLDLSPSLTPHQVGHFTLDNAESNAVAMEELELLLLERENATEVGFGHLENRVRCYAHIINICSSHIVASMTSTSKSYLANLRVPVGSNHVACDSDDDDFDTDDDFDADDDFGSDHGIKLSRVAESFDNQEDPELKEWFSGIERDPLRRARRLVNFFRASDQRKEGLRQAIKKGNESNKFIGTDEKGKPVVIKLPELELLKDVKTRWDSVYMMVERLRQLRPVRLSCRSDVITDWTLNIGHRDAI